MNVICITHRGVVTKALWTLQQIGTFVAGGKTVEIRGFETVENEGHDSGSYCIIVDENKMKDTPINNYLQVRGLSFYGNVVIMNDNWIASDPSKNTMDDIDADEIVCALYEYEKMRWLLDD